MMNAYKAGMTDKVALRRDIVLWLFGKFGMYRGYGVGNGIKRISHFVSDTAAQAFQKRNF